MINHSNAGIIITNGDTIYDKGLYIVTEPDLELTDGYITFSKPLAGKRILIQTYKTEASFFAIGIEERKQLAAWLLDGIEEGE